MNRNHPAKGSSGRTDKGWRRDLAINITLVLSSLLLFCLLLELALQAYVWAFHPRFTRIDPVVGWSHEPSASRPMEKEGHRYQLSYNRHGYRAPEHEYAKPPGVTRIVVLGDSFTDGSEVDDTETFTWLLQQRLPNVEVINLGVYSYSPSQELLTLEREGLRYAPDLVLLVTVPNDFAGIATNITNIGPAPRHLLEGDGLRLEPVDSPAAREHFAATTLPLPGWVWLHRYSHLYSLLNQHLYLRFIAADELIARKRTEFTAQPEAQRIETYRRIVLQMQKLAAEARADLRIAFAFQRSDLKKTLVPSRATYKALTQQLAADGLTTWDLYDELRAEELSGEDSLYYAVDIHWNRRGHAFISDFLEKRIRQWLAERRAVEEQSN